MSCFASARARCSFQRGSRSSTIGLTVRQLLLVIGGSRRERVHTSHMILHLIQRDILSTIWTNPQLSLLSLRQRPRHVVAPDLHLSLSEPLLRSLLRLPFSILLFLPFPILVVRTFHFHVHPVFFLVNRLLPLVSLMLMV